MAASRLRRVEGGEGGAALPVYEWRTTKQLRSQTNAAEVHFHRRKVALARPHALRRLTSRKQPHRRRVGGSRSA